MTTFLFSHFFVVPQKGFIFWGTKKKNEDKKFMSFFPCISFRQQELRLRFVEIPNCTISVSLTIEIHKNIDNFSVTDKQYYKIILF